MGFASLLGEEESQTDEAKEMANIIMRSSQRMYKLITDLLEVAAQEAGKTQLEKSFVNLSDLLSAVVEENRPNAQAKAQTLHLVTEPHLLVEVDSAKIRQVFDNLISNAIKYSPYGKSITVSSQRLTASDTNANASTAYVQVAIKDEGQGLSEDDMKNLFGKFKRLSAKPTGGESSTGLGLSIAKQLVELHGGRIWAESEGKGKGATFFVELPVSSQKQERFLPGVPSAN
jgi:signal transduction histidine kinase